MGPPDCATFYVPIQFRTVIGALSLGFVGILSIIKRNKQLITNAHYIYIGSYL